MMFIRITTHKLYSASFGTCSRFTVNHNAFLESNMNHFGCDAVPIGASFLWTCKRTLCTLLIRHLGSMEIFCCEFKSLCHILLFKLEVRIDHDSDWSLFSFVYSSVRKLMAVYESLSMDTNTLERRVTVPKQDDGHSCGWRVALNALLLLRSIFQLPSEDVSIFQLPYACVLLFIFLYIVILILCLHGL